MLPIQSNNITDQHARSIDARHLRRPQQKLTPHASVGCTRSRDSLFDCSQLQPYPQLHICHHASSQPPSSDEQQHSIHSDRSYETSHAHSHKQQPRCTRPPWTNQRSSSTLPTTRLLLFRWPSSRTLTLWTQSKRSMHTISVVLLLRAQGSTFVKSALRARPFMISSLSFTSLPTVGSNKSRHSNLRPQTLIPSTRRLEAGAI